MTVYTVHVRDTGLKPTLALVKDGFSWPAAIFGVLWALVIGAWDVALVLLVVQVGFGLALPYIVADSAAQVVVQIGFAVVVGLVAGELRRWSLARKGLIEDAVVSAYDKEDAERRYLDANPYMTAKLLRE